MGVFVINKCEFEIMQIIMPYAVLKSKLTGHIHVYNIGGCKQYEQQYPASS